MLMCLFVWFYIKTSNLQTETFLQLDERDSVFRYNFMWVTLYGSTCLMGMFICLLIGRFYIKTSNLQTKTFLQLYERNFAYKLISQIENFPTNSRGLTQKFLIKKKCITSCEVLDRNFHKQILS